MPVSGHKGRARGLLRRQSRPGLGVGQRDARNHGASVTPECISVMMGALPVSGHRARARGLPRRQSRPGLGVGRAL